MRLLLTLGCLIPVIATAQPAPTPPNVVRQVIQVQRVQSPLICPRCGGIHTGQTRSTGVQWPEVNRDQAAYNWAKEEATINARRGRSGHSKGVAPGARYSGTGMNHDPNRPWHCFGPGQRKTRQLSDSRLIARARVIDRRGRVFWSAHYR